MVLVEIEGWGVDPKNYLNRFQEILQYLFT